MRREKRRSIRYLLLSACNGQDGSGVLVVFLVGSPGLRYAEALGYRQGVDQCGQATKGVWGMPRRQQAKKGVEDCDKPGGLVKRELIPGSLNHLHVNP